MKKLKYIRKGACIGAAVLMLGACGQKENADAVSTQASAETTLESSEQETETSAEKEDKEKEEETTKETSVEETAEEEGSSKESQEEAEESTKEEASLESSKEETSKEETSKAEETSTAAEETPAAAQGSAKNVQDIYTEISQAVSLNSPMLVPDDFIMNYYGIDVSTLDEYVFSMSEAAISAETVVILKAKDAGSTGALSASLQTVIDQKRSEMENYLPDQFQIVDKSSVQVKGNYVYLVISEQADAINQIIQADLP